ncbi:hypothetical protein FQR65_LT07147 [Abscondita terminalis]|nr:hypothetical protein FQR65_LT07147 [Abscondita terminalis]
MLNSIDSKPQSHQDSLIMLIVPLLGKVNVPMDPSQKHSLFGLNEKVHVKKHMLVILLDVLLLPYGVITTKNTDNHQTSGVEVSLAVPPGMSEYSFKRLSNEFPLHPEDLEQSSAKVQKRNIYNLIF